MWQQHWGQVLRAAAEQVLRQGPAVTCLLSLFDAVSNDPGPNALGHHGPGPSCDLQERMQLPVRLLLLGGAAVLLDGNGFGCCNWHAKRPHRVCRKGRWPKSVDRRTVLKNAGEEVEGGGGGQSASMHAWLQVVVWEHAARFVLVCARFERMDMQAGESMLSKARAGSSAVSGGLPHSALCLAPALLL